MAKSHLPCKFIPNIRANLSQAAARWVILKIVAKGRKSYIKNVDKFVM
jgi:hypothetical protein